MATAGKPIKCRAAIAWGVNKPYTIETVEVAVPKKGEVRVKMGSTGICHSDLHNLEGIDEKYPFPSVFGHEGAGVIESVGEGVTDLQPGDVVVLTFESHCGDCKYCKDSKTNLCLRTPRNHLQMDGTSRITYNGKVLSQMNSISTNSEYTVTSQFNVAKVNPRADPHSLCLAGCCIPTGYGAAMNAGQVSPGSTCAVWGLGGVGMCVVMGCRDSKAAKIIGIDTNPQKFALAKDLGCTDVLNPNDVPDVPKKLAEMTDGGVDFCFVSVGIISVMEEAFKSSHPNWGKTVIIGLSNIGETIRAGVWELIYGRKLVGTSYGSYKAKLAVPKLVEKVLSGDIPLNKLITHRLPLDRINDGYEMLKTGESLRAIVDFDLKA
ncbi:alcohol dehydrogenase class-3 chain L-like isoform X1 [Stegodyphus dumicola]|uniref:alcohol dehydrogenase class-3 chain L-like isoform X1 n=1 Tax=Stegodyphus dumicola TaxID=202533 RepID=UPI0015B1CEF4|nr:alcohol dehydrogenase class-3 chain L-like isoform X1 [Stegodyphus dumicola]XP_035227742.1 alcohol dehydrogenase class-3 chain L-like isoform X1 [Stegodyphus dumicola]